MEDQSIIQENYKLILSNKKLDIQDAFNFVQSPDCGATDIFIGTVRNNNENQEVTSLSYDVHPTLTMAQLEKLAKSVLDKEDIVKIYLSHAYGLQNIGDISVIIAVSSAHSPESFDVCKRTLKELKQHIPIWKNETYKDNPTKWLNGADLNESKM